MNAGVNVDLAETSGCAMRNDYKVIQYSVSTSTGECPIGCKRVGVFVPANPPIGVVHMHELTENGWEDRDLNEATIKLLQDAMIGAAPLTANEKHELDGWRCIFSYRAGAEWRLDWFQYNSVGELVRRDEGAVPVETLCRILATFLAAR